MVSLWLAIHVHEIFLLPLLGKLAMQMKIKEKAYVILLHHYIPGMNFILYNVPEVCDYCGPQPWSMAGRLPGGYTGPPQLGRNQITGMVAG